MRSDRPPVAITLDLDDTLWPVGPTLVAAEAVLSEWLQRHAPRTAAATDAARRAGIRAGVLADHPERAHDLGFVRLEVLRRALRAAGEDPSLAQPAFEVFLEARQSVRLYDDVLPVLERWSRRYRLVALTNGNADIRRVGLDGLFSGSVSAHLVGFAKPDPRIFEEACRVAGAEPADVLHLGDDPLLDVAGARRAGLQAAWIRRPDIAHRHPPQACESAPFADLHAVDAALRALAPGG
jgi:2-haloalkanoic acid dehalogenase type II